MDGPWLVCVAVLLSASAPTSLAGILDPFGWARSDQLDVNIPWLPFENDTRCYDDLGCLNITRSWYHLINRPFNVFPLAREVINTRFVLYTHDNPTEGRILRVHDEPEFDASRPTKLIVHGFIDTPLSGWVGELRDELLRHGDYNVIVVDWAGGSLPLYTQATANTRLVGLEIAHLLRWLARERGLRPKQVHLIGHSLGAHTAGYAGALVPGLGRITGLDPAEPYFQGMPAHVRLDPTDAELVDVIHTDGKSIFLLGYGMSQPCGHLDFYPNNGKEQPGCDIAATPLVPLTLVRDGLEEASRVLVACNHVRAIKIFIDSINSRCPYVAHRCPSFRHYLDGRCYSCRSSGTSSGCAVMGYHADTSPALGGSGGDDRDNELTSPVQLPVDLPGKFFTTTGREPPFCRRHYRVSVSLARPASAESWVQGVLRATLHGDAAVIRDVELTPRDDLRLEHGTTRVLVISHPIDVGGHVRRLELSWEYDMNVLEPRSICLFWCNDHLYVSSVTVEQMDLPLRGKREADPSNRLCSSSKRNYADIPNRGRATFYDNCKEPS